MKAGMINIMQSKKIYLAARYSRLEELREYRDTLEEAGCIVTSRWLDNKANQRANAEAVERAVHEIPLEAWVFAVEDIQDIRACDILLSFTEKPKATRTRGGRHVEFGIAWGLKKQLWIVGPRETVFHSLDCVTQFATFEAALRELRKDAPPELKRPPEEPKPREIKPASAKAAKRLVECGVLSINEARKALFMDTIPQDEALRRERLVFHRGRNA